MNLYSNGHQSEVISKTDIENTIGLPLVSHRVTAVVCVSVDFLSQIGKAL